MTAVSDLIVARSQVVIRTGIYAELAAADVPIEGLQSTSILRALPEITAALEASGEEARVAVTKGGYISGAESLAAPEWLNLHGEDFFSLTRDAAVRTAGTFRIAASATASATTIGTGKLVVRAGTVRFESVEPFTPSPGGAVNVRVRAQIAGIAGNIATGATLVLVTSYPGLTATNPAVSGGTSWITTRGRNAEAQKSYAARMRARWADLAPQTSAERATALVRAACVAAGVAVIARVWPDDSNPLGPGSWAVYLARDTGPASAEDVALVEGYVGPRWASGAGRFKAYPAGIVSIAVSGTIKGPSNETTALTQAAAALSALAESYDFQRPTVAYLEQRRSALMAEVTGAVNVVLVGQDEPIPPGSIVAFSIGALSVVP